MNMKEGGVIQVAYVVRDLEAAMKRHWRSPASGRWHIYKFEPGKIQNYVYRGKPANHTCWIAVTPMGEGLGCQVELMQPISGYSIYDEHLETKGEGFHHVKLYYPGLRQGGRRICEARLSGHAAGQDRRGRALLSRYGEGLRLHDRARQRRTHPRAGARLPELIRAGAQFTFSTKTLIRPPQERPTRHAVSSATPNSSIFGLPDCDHVERLADDRAFDAAAGDGALEVPFRVDDEMAADRARRGAPGLDHRRKRHVAPFAAPALGRGKHIEMRIDRGVAHGRSPGRESALQGRRRAGGTLQASRDVHGDHNSLREILRRLKSSGRIAARAMGRNHATDTRDRGRSCAPRPRRLQQGEAATGADSPVRTVTVEHKPIGEPVAALRAGGGGGDR